MLLNRVERAIMNNPVRAIVQRHFEARRLLRMGGPLTGGLAIEVGGRGVGIELILDVFGADAVVGVDADPDMVALAAARHRAKPDRVEIWQASMTRLPHADDTFDAAFDFGSIHHVPRWRAAVAEVFRVLRPGGKLYAEEVMHQFIAHPLWRRVLAHPQHDRFNVMGFATALQEAGFIVTGTQEMWGDYGWFVAEKPLLSA